MCDLLAGRVPDGQIEFEVATHAEFVALVLNHVGRTPALGVAHIWRVITLKLDAEGGAAAEPGDATFPPQQMVSIQVGPVAQIARVFVALVVDDLLDIPRLPVIEIVEPDDGCMQTNVGCVSPAIDEIYLAERGGYPSVVSPSLPPALVKVMEKSPISGADRYCTPPR